MPVRDASHIVETISASWSASKYEGVEFLPLHTDRDQRCGSFLYRMAPGSAFPRHRHPAGEELLLLKGDLAVGGRTLKPGDYVYSPPGSIHEMRSEGGCVLLKILAKPLEMIGTSRFEELEPTEEPAADPPAAAQEIE